MCLQRSSPVFQCPCYNSSKVQNLVWWKLHIVRLPSSSHWRRPRRPLMAFNMCAQAWDPDPFGRGDPLGASGVTQSLTTALCMQKREPSFHSGTVSAKWTPQSQCAASPRRVEAFSRLSPPVPFHTPEWKRSLFYCFICCFCSFVREFMNYQMNWDKVTCINAGSCLTLWPCAQ